MPAGGSAACSPSSTSTTRPGSPGTCSRVSRLLYQRTPAEKYATAVIAAIDAASGSVEYANAGHNPGLVVRGDGAVEMLGPTGVPLGLLPNMPYRAATVTLQPGDSLVLYTDGITEAADDEEEELGLERLVDVCRAHREASAAELADAIDGAVAAFVAGRPPGDDRTLLIARRIAAPTAG